MRAIKYKTNFQRYRMKDLLRECGLNKKQKYTAIQEGLDLLEILKIIKPDKWIPVGIKLSTSNYGRERDKQKREELKKVLENAKHNIISNLFNDKKVVFTGKMSASRAEMMEIAVKYGATTANTVSKKTDLLVVGTDAGSKLSKAKELGIKIASEEEFWEMLNDSVSNY